MCYTKISTSYNNGVRQTNVADHQNMKGVYYRSISGNGNSFIETDSDSEDFKITEDITTSDAMDAGTAVRDILVAAQEQGRLTCGIYESAQLLELNPEGVLFCVLPEDAATDVTLHIHFTLIEAFCWENDIQVVKVDSSDKLCQILSKEDTNDNDLAAGRLPADFNCLLVEVPLDELSGAEDDVQLYHKKTCDQSPQPVITLPV